MSDKTRVLFVCTGNTCRSPMAAALAEDIFKKAGLDVDIFSAGVMAANGMPASSHAITAMEEYGLDLLSHKSQALTEAVVKQAHIVLAMTMAHKIAVAKTFCKAKVWTIGEYAGQHGDILDPFGQNLEKYRACAKQIKALLLEAKGKI